MKNFKIVLLVSLFTSSLMVNAQAKFKIGLGGGVNFSTVSGLDYSNNSMISVTSQVTGFNVGIITELGSVGKFAFELDLFYSQKGYDLKITYSDTPIPFYSKDRIKYIDLPLVVKFKLLKVINLQAGFQYSMLLHDDAFGIGAVKFNDYAVVLGFGIDVSRFHFSARYNYGLSSIDDGGADVKNNMLTLSVGLWLKK